MRDVLDRVPTHPHPHAGESVNFNFAYNVARLALVALVVGYFVEVVKAKAPRPVAPACECAGGGSP